MRNYYDPAYSKFRREVRQRDNYCCRWPQCKVKKKLQVHHILRWHDYPQLRYYIGNGITLCKQHHNLTKGKEELYAPLFTKIIAGII